jgi:UrcA family protein
MNKLALAAAASVALTGITAAPAAAQDVRVQVSYADLDIATPQGASTLAGRIAASVKDACAAPAVRDLKSAVLAETCRAEMLTSAVAQLNAKGAGHVAQDLAVRG